MPSAMDRADRGLTLPTRTVDGIDDGDCGGSDGGDDLPAEEADDLQVGSYVVETAGQVRARRDEVTARTSERLSVPPGYAAVLLRRFRWDAERLEEAWFSSADGHRAIRDASGLPPTDGVAPTKLNARPLTCAACFDARAPGEMASAGCSHYYCRGCWRGYVRAAARDGRRCLSLRCPDPRCSAAVVEELVRDVAADEDAEAYSALWLSSYVEERKDGAIRWCPGPGCALAVVRSLAGGSELRDVACACGHAFCFRCGEEAHRPASCDTARAWVAKHGSDRETANWLVANTKPCPRCLSPIERYQGCMRITCPDPCGHQFCWLCLVPWDKHAGDVLCQCKRRGNAWADGVAAVALTAADVRRGQAKAALERYLHYYERWNAHGAAREKARADLDALLLEGGGGLSALVATVRAPPAELGFVARAYAQVVECRRALRWACACAYFLDPERDGARRELCGYVLGEAEPTLERLHRCAEQEREELCLHAAAADAGSAGEMPVEYREKLSALTVAARKQLNGLVKGFEDGMAEVVA